MRNVRLFLFVVAIVIVQVTVMPHLRFARGPRPRAPRRGRGRFDVGPEAGAIVGFVAGLGYDLFLETPLGFNALVYALVGYGVGVIEGGLFRSPRLLPSFLALLGGVAGGLLFDRDRRARGRRRVKGTHGVVTISIAALYDALLAPLVFFLVALVLGRSEPVKSAWS